MDERPLRKRAHTVIVGDVEKLVQIGTQVNVRSPPLWPRVLASISRRLHFWLVEKEILPAPEDFQAERGYLEWFIHEFRRRNLGELRHVPLAGRVDGGEAQGEYLPEAETSVPLGRVRSIRRNLHLLKSAGQEGDTAFSTGAPPARSRLVRNVARLLSKARLPVVLLGDPGSGKSTTLREIGVRVAERARHRVGGLIPIYVALGSFSWRFDADSDRDLMQLIALCLPEAHSAMREALPRLIAQRRLLILFDAMDEMERTIYAQRVARLSRFASEHVGRVRTVFSCRTNDFLTSFRHARLLLQPLDRSQIREYVRLNFKLPVHIDGTPLDAGKVTERLLDDAHLDASNPLILFLIQHFVAREGRWPERSGQLFRTYLDSVVRRFNEFRKRSGQPEVDADALRDDWAELAFEIARERGSVYLEVAVLSSRWGTERARAVVESGLRSGLLIVEFAPGSDTQTHAHTPADADTQLLTDADSIGFFHHRIQEYLCAHHLLGHADAGGSLSWQKLIDAPRWQETILHLVSLGGDAGSVLSILMESGTRAERSYRKISAARERVARKIASVCKEREAIRPPARATAGRQNASFLDARCHALDRRLERLRAVRLAWTNGLPPALERKLADRVTLAARILADAPRGSALSEARETLDRVVKTLSAEGRPTTKLKMLEAWRAAPGIISISSLERAFRSHVSWLRDQAVLILGSLTTARGLGAPGGLAEQIVHDFAAGSLPARLLVFLRAARGRHAGVGFVLWALFCHSLYVAIIACAAFGMVRLTANAFTLNVQLPGPLPPLHDAFLPIIALAALLASTTLLSRRSGFASFFLLCAGVICSLALAVAFHSRLAPLFFERSSSNGWQLFRLLLLCCAPLTAASLIPAMAYLVTRRVLLVPLSRISGCAAGSLPVWHTGRWTPELAAFLIGAVSVSLALACSFPYATLVLIIVLIALAVYLFVTLALLQGMGGLSWASITLSAVVTLPFALIVIATFVATPRSLIIAVVLGVLPILLAWLLIRGGTAFRRLRYALFRRGWKQTTRGDASPEKWLEGMRTGEPEYQAQLLHHLSTLRSHVSLADLLRLMEICESKISAEPAQSLYWRLRHELEEEARQQEEVGMSRGEPPPRSTRAS